MRRGAFFLFALLIATAAAAAEPDYAVVRVRLSSVHFEGYPDNGEVYIGAQMIAKALVTEVLYGAFDDKQFDLDMNVPDASPLRDIYLVVGKDSRGDFHFGDFSRAESGFCINPVYEHSVPADVLLRLQRRFPCIERGAK